jgi:hypothetical protein
MQSHDLVSPCFCTLFGPYMTVDCCTPSLCSHILFLNSKQCRHEYCWICSKDWSLHSNKTGGFYRCNRFEEESVVSTDNRGEGSASDDMRKRMEQSVRADRFIHYYTRFAAQESSSKMEQKKRAETLSRIKLLQRRLNSSCEYSNSNTETNGGEVGAGGGGGHVVLDESSSSADSAWCLTTDLRTVSDDVDVLLSKSFLELEQCRLVLRNSYAFAHLKLSNEEMDKQSREHRRDRRRILFSDLKHSSLRCEAAQSELESITETLSEILARRYMVCSCHVIVYNCCV